MSILETTAGSRPPQSLSGARGQWPGVILAMAVRDGPTSVGAGGQWPGVMLVMAMWDGPTSVGAGG
jgi:hypothetical protein